MINLKNLKVSNLKYGDELYCYKNDPSSTLHPTSFKKGNFYTIRKIEIEYSKYFPDGYCKIDILIYIDQYEERYKEFTLEELKQFFYTKKELRKRKLDELI